MLPETRQIQTVRLYQAHVFPDQWTPVGALIAGDYADPSIVFYQGRWWLFALRGKADLCLFQADDLAGPWSEHPQSPLVASDPTKARTGGRLVIFNDKLIRFAQNCVPVYGYQLRAFQIDTLTATEYQEYEVDAQPVLTPVYKSWNSFATHHADPHPLGPENWIACVDGARLSPL